jgi:hypothetical protein
MNVPTVTYCMNNPDQARDCTIDTCPFCGGLGVAARCPSCAGAGATMVRTKREAELAHSSQFEGCTTCNGMGYFPISEALFLRLGFDEPGAWQLRHPRKPIGRVA